MISAVIITRNEARNIGRCLESLRGVVAETIVIDASSEDETEEICKKYGATFVQQEWEGYSKAKNLGNSLAKQAYILSIDADEALSDELKASMLSISKNPGGAYAFARRNIYCGKAIMHCGWYPDEKVRLFPRGRAQWEGDYVHETLKLDKELSVSQLSGDLLHYTCYSIEEHIERINRYSTLAAEEMHAKGRKAPWLKLIFSAPSRFFRLYVLKAGFLDGFYGFVICRLSAQSVFLRYAKLRSLRKGENTN